MMKSIKKISVGNIQFSIIKRDDANYSEVIIENLNNEHIHTLNHFDKLEDADIYMKGIQLVLEGLIGEQYDYPDMDMSLFEGFHALICPDCGSGTYSSWALLRHLKEKHSYKEIKAIQAVTEEIKNNDSTNQFRVEL